MLTTFKKHQSLDGSSPAQVTDSTVMRSKQIFFTLSPDGLTQFSLDHTVFIDLKRWFFDYQI